MIKVLEVRPDGTAVVSTEGLMRVVLQPGNEIHDELVEPWEAEACLSGYNGLVDGHWAEAIDYAEVARREAAGNVAAGLQVA